MKTKILFVVSWMILLGLTVMAQDAMMKDVRSKTDPVKIGETAPDFALTDENGKTVKLSDVKQPVMLVFYRGYWCPFCVRQLAELRSLKQKGDKFQIYAISVDPAERTTETRRKVAKDGNGEISFSLLSDPAHKTIDAYGLYDPAYAGRGFDGIPHPAVIILDKDRKIVWAKVETDYKFRPKNDELRAELNKLKN